MKYKSPTTPQVNHDSSNLLAEVILLNKYKNLPLFCWRDSFKNEWSELVKVIRKLLKINIGEEQLAWYIKKYNIETLSFKDFGLFVFKIRKFFKRINLQELSSYYTQLIEIQIKKSELDQSINTGAFNVKAPTLNKTKSLSDILKEIENEGR